VRHEFNNVGKNWFTAQITEFREIRTQLHYKTTSLFLNIYWNV